MQRCEKCGISLVGSHAFCPLCQGPVSGTPQPEEEIFPVLPLKKPRLWVRIMAFLSVAIAGISLAVNYAFPSGGWWCILVAAGLACLWVSFGFAVIKRRNIPKSIVWQTIILSLAAFGWDHFTGHHGWSVNYVIPLLCTSALLAVILVGRITRHRLADYLVYLILNILLGIIPLIFLLWGQLYVRWPSLLCLTISLLSLAALAIFRGSSLLAEVQRRTHL